MPGSWVTHGPCLLTQAPSYFIYISKPSSALLMEPTCAAAAMCVQVVRTDLAELYNMDIKVGLKCKDVNPNQTLDVVPVTVLAGVLCASHALLHLLPQQR